MSKTYLQELNPSQREAVTKTEGPLLVLAGAGSGKTKTMIARTVHLIDNGVRPEKILLLTFTVKAAKEMLERGESILRLEGVSTSQSPVFSNFHSFSFKLIRSYSHYIDEIGERFTIADENMQKSIVKQEIKYVFGEEQKEYKDKHFLYLLTFLENRLGDYSSVDAAVKSIEGLFADKKTFVSKDACGIDIGNEGAVRQIAEVYVNYKHTLRRNNMLDFDDLINIPVKYARKNKDFAFVLKDMFDYVMVDEFQDTNYSQIEFIKLFLNERRNICVVGDNDQGIYGWRGAEIDYILNFQKMFEGADVVNLNINYRSTSKIVQMANKLMHYSEERHSAKEDLTAFSDLEGEITLLRSYDADEEAAEIGRIVEETIATKRECPEEIAVLYRTNAVSNKIEQEFILRGIPYTILKGRAIFNTKGFQEFFSFVSFAHNFENDVALESLLTSGAKYLSANKVKEIRDYCRSNGMKIYEFIFDFDNYSDIKLIKPQKQKLGNLSSGMKEISESNGDVSVFRDIFYQRFNLVSEYNRVIQTSKSETTVEAAERALKYIEIGLEMLSRSNTIEEFLDKIALTADPKEDESGQKAVKMMTVHASKGLEFGTVFVASASEGLFPLEKATHSIRTLEEERRLMYVAITRAKRSLYVSCIRRYYKGETTISRFFDNLRDFF